MRSLVTGACGFVGTNLVLDLLKKGNQVMGADSLSRKGSELNLEAILRQFPDFNFFNVEIEDLPSVIYKVKPDLVYHFAAQVAVTHSLSNPRRDFMINGVGTFEVALAAKNIGAPVIFTSTNKVFGDNVNEAPIRELEKRYDYEGELKEKGIPETFSIDAKHHTPYGCSKLVGDIYVREFGGVVNRCSCMYGRYQHGISDQGWLSYFAINKILGKPNYCEHCKCTDKRRYDWSNKTHIYNLIPKNWQRLCRSCHIKYDTKYNNYHKTYGKNKNKIN